MRYLHNGNHLKERHLWLILKGISQNMAFHLLVFSRSNNFGHHETYRHAENLAGQFQAIKLKGLKLTYHSYEKNLDIFQVELGWYPRLCVYLNYNTN